MYNLEYIICLYKSPSRTHECSIDFITQGFQQIPQNANTFGWTKEVLTKWIHNIFSKNFPTHSLQLCFICTDSRIFQFQEKRIKCLRKCEKCKQHNVYVATVTSSLNAPQTYKLQMMHSISLLTMKHILSTFLWLGTITKQLTLSLEEIIDFNCRNNERRCWI